MLTVLKRLIKEEEGQGLVEYAVIIAVVSIALVATLNTFRGKIGDVFTSIGTTLDTYTP